MGAPNDGNLVEATKTLPTKEKIPNSPPSPHYPAAYSGGSLSRRGHVGDRSECIHPPTLQGIGIPTPDHLVRVALSYRIAQKAHAVADPHDPPVAVNDRARGVVDLFLLRTLVELTGRPEISEVRNAIRDVFRSRAQDAGKQESQCKIR